MLATGTEIGGYRIEAVLGRGGMGVVYEATQLSLGRTVALKLLATELGEDQAFRERFRREARMQARIDHTHIVPVYEAGEFDAGLFIAMRLIRGANLKQLIRAGELTPERTQGILVAVADALDTAHESGLIHRDIKPQNILVDRRDHAFLADFGLTKGPGDTGFTRTGQLMGTLDYVSPEQIRGEQGTAASDVYALAAVAYECLVGTAPFARPSEAAVLYAHVAEPPPRASQARRDLPPGVDDVIARGLAKSPEERFPDAGALVRALGTALVGSASINGSGEPAALAAPVVPEPVTAEDPVEEDEGEPTTRIERPRGRPAAATPPPESAPTLPEPEPEPARDVEESSQPHDLVGETAGRTLGSPTITDHRRERAIRAPSGETAPGAREQRAGRRSRRGLAAAAAAALVATTAGYLIGDAGTEGVAPAGTTVAAEDLRVRAPGGWQRATPVPEVPGLSLVRDAAVRPADGRGAVVFGISDGTGATLLPASLRDRLGEAPEPDATVRLGELEAYRYDELRPEGSPAAMTLFVAPTTSGIATVACLEPLATDACERVAGSLEAGSSLRPLELGPSEAYGRALGGVLRDLDRRRSSAQRDLARARRPAAQAKAAAAVAGAYERAARELRQVRPTPLEREAHRTLVSAVASAAGAYEGLGRAARAKSRSRYPQARAAARRADDAVERAVLALEPLGYEVG